MIVTTTHPTTARGRTPAVTISAEREKVIGAMKAADGPVLPETIATATKVNLERTKAEIERMVKAGEVRISGSRRIMVAGKSSFQNLYVFVHPDEPAVKYQDDAARIMAPWIEAAKNHYRRAAANTK
jgi:hypothetical protein